MSITVAAVYRKVPEGIGYFEELLGANTQGATLEETVKTSKKRLIQY